MYPESLSSLAEQALDLLALIFTGMFSLLSKQVGTSAEGRDDTARPKIWIWFWRHSYKSATSFLSLWTPNISSRNEDSRGALCPLPFALGANLTHLHLHVYKQCQLSKLWEHSAGANCVTLQTMCKAPFCRPCTTPQTMCKAPFLRPCVTLQTVCKAPFHRAFSDVSCLICQQPNAVEFSDFNHHLRNENEG